MSVNPKSRASQGGGSESGYTPLLWFIVLAFGLAWGVFAYFGHVARAAGLEDAAMAMAKIESMEYADIRDRLPAPFWLLYLLTRVADFAFSIAGIVVLLATGGLSALASLGKRLVQWRVPLRWYIAACIPLFCYGVAVALAVTGEASVRNSFTFNGAVLWAVLFGANGGIMFSFFLRGAMGEELGLRGFALPFLQARHSTARASAFIGVFWVLWHVPVLVGRDPLAVVAFSLLVFCLSFVFAWIYNGAGGSLLPVMVFHTFQNSEEAFEMVLPGLVGSDWETVAVLMLLVVAGVIAVRVAMGKCAPPPATREWTDSRITQET